ECVWVMFLGLVEQYEMVEHGNGRPDGRDRRLLVDRHAGRAVAMKEFEDPAGLLGNRGNDEEITQRAAQQRQHTGNAWHDLPFLFGRLSITRNRSRDRRRCPVKTAAALGGTEMRVLTTHAGKLYADNGYWEDQPGPEGLQGAEILLDTAGRAGGWAAHSPSSCPMGAAVIWRDYLRH